MKKNRLFPQLFSPSGANIMKLSQKLPLAFVAALPLPSLAARL
jgi:hypothetical protein